MAELDLKTVKPLDRHFVDERLKHLYADCLFEAAFANQPGFLYLLIEHQSTVHPRLAFRLWQYMVSIWDDFIREHGQAKSLPLIYPIALYNGPGPYTGTLDLRDLIAGPRALVDQVLARPFPILDLSQIDDERIKRSLHLGILLLTLKHAYDDIMPFEGILDQLSQVQNEPELYYFLRGLIRYILEVRDELDPADLQRAIQAKLSKGAGEEVMTVAELLREEGRQEGRREGHQEGRQEGRREGRQEGRREGRRQGLEEAAVNLLNAGAEPQFVATNTGLSLDRVLTLKARGAKP